MSTRISMPKAAPEAYHAMLAFEKYMASTSIDPIQKELIKIRASQINGCAYCLDMHSRDARKLGETEQRIYCLSAWRDTDFYTEEEQAVLALTEEVTLISNHVKDETFNKAAALFGEKKVSEIIMAIVIINSWNRIAITSRTMPLKDA